MFNSSARPFRIVLLIIYSFAGIGIFVGAILSPSFRSIAYAPLRELILPKPEPILLSVLYSTEKEAWLEEVVVDFYATDPRVNGRPVQIELSKSGSREIYLSVLDGSQPDMISPASSLQISILQALSASKFGVPVVDPNERASCRPVVQTPLVLVAWKERVDVLWGNAPGNDLWLKLHDAVIDPRGWNAYGHPEWGFIKYGQTSPLTSNSGFMAILQMTYGYFGKTSGLTSQDILSDTDYQAWFLEFQNSVPQFGDSTGTYMRDIVAFGPSTYDMVAVYEATAIEQADNAVGRYGELRVYYPPATIMSDHPFCILRGEWVTPEKEEAAQLFMDYLVSEPAQQLALSGYGFRPVTPGIALDQPGSPFTRYAANGLLISLPPSVEIPAGNVLDTLLEFWNRNVQR